MQYLGGKAKVAAKLVSAILDTVPNRDAYFEPFVGGANVLTVAAPHFARAVASDSHVDVILLWQALRLGWLPPEAITAEEYAALKTAEPSALRGFAGFGCSFGGKWFGGYAKQATKGPMANYTYCQVSRSAILKQVARLRSCDVLFTRADYASLTPPPGTVVYSDPPYANTTPYAGTAPFDSDKFWHTAITWAEHGAHVFVSDLTVLFPPA